MGAVSSLQALILFWAAQVLPWQAWTLFSALTLLTALSHVLLAASCLGWPELAPRLWRLTSLCSLSLLSWVSWIAFSGGAYLVGLYGGLGRGLFAALVAVWSIAVLLTLPTSLWGLVRTRTGGGVKGLLGLAAALIGGALALGWGYQRSLPDVLEAPLSVGELEQLAKAPRDEPGFDVPLQASLAAQCAEPITSRASTLLLGYLALPAYPGDVGRPKSACVQGATRGEVLERATRLLEQRAQRNPVKVDWVLTAAAIEPLPFGVAPLSVRPGLDGVCLGTLCLSPWQLLAQEAYVSFAPLSFLRDVRFGVALEQLKQELTADGQEPGPWLRIHTQSAVLSGAGAVRGLSRMRVVPADQEADHVRRRAREMTQLAERHVLSALLPDGKFRYTLDPFTGAAETKDFNLARQAGTVLVLCELGGKGPEIQQAIDKALQRLLEHERIIDGERSALTLSADQSRARLASNVLPLVAFVRCRSRVGRRFDPLIGRLNAFVLSMQRPDGGFHPYYQLGGERVGPVPGAEPLYVAGQSILAWVSLESTTPDESLVFDRAATAAAAQRAMDYTTHAYWGHALAPFFFIEENWHCIAARAALAAHRDPDYERFCLDYVTFKSRLILDESSGVAEDFWGGYGFGNVIPPHNTATAGFGEAMAAAVTVAQARGEDSAEMKTVLSRVVSYLSQQQWTEQNCFACRREALGAVSESSHAPLVRIDYVQHAWAAVGGGLEVL